MALFLVKNSTIKNRKYYTLFAFLFWLIVWFILSLVVGEEMLLPSPLETLSSLAKNIRSAEFWFSILTSLKNIVFSLLISLVLSSLFAFFANNYYFVETLLSPIVKTVRSVPVASVIILILLWVKSKNLSLVISFLVTFPLLYTSILSGLKNTSSELLEMASSYSVGLKKRIRYILLPELFPFLKNGISNAIGLGWKSSVAAEVIALPKNTLGSMLYESKVYLLSSDLFALTLTIVLLSICFEKLSIFLLGKLEARIMR